jgi:hypothetical protein
VFRFFSVYVQCRIIFSHCFSFISTTCFTLTGHHQVYRLLQWRNCCSAAVLLWLRFILATWVNLTICFIWMSLKNCYARVCLICNIWCVMLELYFKVYMYIQFLYIWCYLICVFKKYNMTIILKVCVVLYTYEQATRQGQTCISFIHSLINGSTALCWTLAFSSVS